MCFDCAEPSRKESPDNVYNWYFPHCPKRFANFSEGGFGMGWDFQNLEVVFPVGWDQQLFEEKSGISGFTTGNSGRISDIPVKRWSRFSMKLWYFE